MNKLIEKMEQITQTANGDMAYTTTGSDVLDMFGKGGAMRQEKEEVII